MDERGIETVVMIVSAVVIAGAIGGGYVFLSSDGDGGSNDGENLAQMEYQSYKNENFEFSFEYPEYWVLKDENIKENSDGENKSVGVQTIVSPISLPENGLGETPEVLVRVAGGDLGIVLENTRKQLTSLKRAVENQFGAGDNHPNLSGPENIERNGVPGISFTSIDPEGFLSQIGIPRGHIRMEFFEGQDFEYRVIFQSRVEVFENHEQVLEHIVESFTPQLSG